MEGQGPAKGRPAGEGTRPTKIRCGCLGWEHTAGVSTTAGGSN
jgi:hypothetical protein